MSDPGKKRSLTRRSLLKTAALSGGVAMVPRFLGASSGRTTHEKPKGIGLLFPSDDPSGLADRIERMLSRRPELRSDRRRIVRETTPGGHSAVRDRLERLFHEEGVDRVLCYVSDLVAPTIAEVATSLRRPVTLLSSGAHPLDHTAVSRWLQVHSLDLFGRNRDRAGEAAEHGRRCGLVLMAQGESGYGTAEAIRQGFESGGGEIGGYVVVDQSSTDGVDRDVVRSAVRDIAPDVIFLLGHPERDADVASDLSALALTTGLPVVRNVTVSTSDLLRLADDAIGTLLQTVSVAPEESAGSQGSYHLGGANGPVGGVTTPYL